MDAYCQRQGLASNQCRFIFDGERLKDDDTPDGLEMENGDEIDVMVEQTGGHYEFASHLCWIQQMLDSKSLIFQTHNLDYQSPWLKSFWNHKIQE